MDTDHLVQYALQWGNDEETEEDKFKKAINTLPSRLG